jgi:prophage regulatory protein
MPAPDRIVRLNTVLTRTGLSRFTIYRKIAEGTFRESDINRWVANPVAWRPKEEVDDGR